MGSIFIIDGKKIKHLTINGKRPVENERIKNQEKENNEATLTQEEMEFRA